MFLYKAIISGVILFIVPTILGLLLLKLFLSKEKNNIVLAYILGIIVEFAICEVISVPMIYLERSFTDLVKLYSIIIGILSFISILINFFNIKSIFKNIFQFTKESPKILMIMAILLIIMQSYVLVGYMHEDADDATYVATATSAVQTNSLYKYSGQTGSEVGEHLVARYRLGPFPLYTAIISSLIEVHPAITAHTIFPIIFIPVAYMIYGVIANKLFNGNKKNVFMFLIILSLLHIWGNYSVRTNFTFLLFRIWQGKAILANIIIPAVWLMFIIAEENDFKFGTCLFMFITILGGVLTTTMGIALPPTVLMSLALVYELSKIQYRDLANKENFNKIKNIIKCFICCIPALIYGGIYFLG